MRYLLFWVPVMVLVVAAVLVSDTARFRTRGRVCGHWTVSLGFVVLVTVYIAVSVELLGFDSPAHAVRTGLAWAGLTLVADLAVAGYVMGGRWAAVLGPYDPRAGHYWAAAIVWVALAPPLLYWLQH